MYHYNYCKPGLKLKNYLCTIIVQEIKFPHKLYLPTTFLLHCVEKKWIFSKTILTH